MECGYSNIFLCKSHYLFTWQYLLKTKLKMKDMKSVSHDFAKYNAADIYVQHTQSHESHLIFLNKMIISIYKYSSRKTIFLSKISEKYFKGFIHLYPMKLQSLHFDVPFFHGNNSTTNCVQHGQMKLIYLKLHTIYYLHTYFCCRTKKYITQMNFSF